MFSVFQVFRFSFFVVRLSFDCVVGVDASTVTFYATSNACTRTHNPYCLALFVLYFFHLYSPFIHYLVYFVLLSPFSSALHFLRVHFLLSHSFSTFRFFLLSRACLVWVHFHRQTKTQSEWAKKKKKWRRALRMQWRQKSTHKEGEGDSEWPRRWGNRRWMTRYACTRCHCIRSSRRLVCAINEMADIHNSNNEINTTFTCRWSEHGRVGI